LKFREGFVSNSSSSSFVIIGSSGKRVPGSNLLPADDGVLHFGLHGVTEFGWGPDTVQDVQSRINFAYLQTQFPQSDPKWIGMLENVIRRETGLTEIAWDVTSNYNAPEGKVWGYIDHQSAASEGRNTEIFDSEDVLTAFIFDQDSLIELDNDNRY
jgi:hypothetical protein